MINILGYNLLEFDEYISETVVVLDKHREYEVLKGIKWYFIELPKFRKRNPNMNEKIDQWLAFLDDSNKEAIEMAEKKNKTLKKAREKMEYLTGDEAVRRLAELREKWEMDYVSGMSLAEERGMEKGIKQGKEEGMREGIKEGVRDGKKEEKRKIAKKLLEKGVTLSEIQEITGLEIEEIKNLKNK